MAPLLRRGTKNLIDSFKDFSVHFWNGNWLLDLIFDVET